MPNTPRFGLPYPAPRTKPATRTWLTYLAEAAETALAQTKDTAAAATSAALSQALSAVQTLRSDAFTAIDDARKMQTVGAVATGTVTVTTAQQGVPGASVQLPANESALCLTTFDVACDAWNGVSAFEGRLGFIRLDTGADQGNASGSAIYASGVVNGRATVTTAYLLGPTTFGRALQLRATKSTSSAGYVTAASTTKINVLRLRTGVL